MLCVQIACRLTWFAYDAAENACKACGSACVCPRLCPDHVLSVEATDGAPGFNKECPIHHKIILRPPVP